MKKTFTVKDGKIKADRQIEAFRSEIKKYIARERRKELPEGFDTWKFDCRFGDSAESAKEIQESDIKTSISAFAASGNASFYLEILAKPANRQRA